MKRSGLRLGAGISALLALTALTGGCAEVVVDATAGAASGAGDFGSNGNAGAGDGSSGASGGNSICPTGAALTAFGASDAEGATIGIAVDASGVYWTNSDGTVLRAEPDGSGVTALATGLDYPQAIAIDETNIHFADSHAVMKIPKAGGPLTVLADEIAVALVLDETHVYFTTGHDVKRVPKLGGAVESLAELAGAASITADAEALYIKTTGTGADTTGRIVRLPKSGGAPAILAESDSSLRYFDQEIAVDAAHVYWLDAGPGTLSKVPKTGGAPAVIAADIPDPVSLAIDGATLYYTIRGTDGGSLAERAVARIGAAGGQPTFVAQGPQVSAFGVAVGPTRVYWTSKVVQGPVHAACK